MRSRYIHILRAIAGFLVLPPRLHFYLFVLPCTVAAFALRHDVAVTMFGRDNLTAFTFLCAYLSVGNMLLFVFLHLTRSKS